MAKKGDGSDEEDDRLRRSAMPTRLPGESVEDYDARRSRGATIPPVATMRERARTVGVDQPLTVLLGERPPEKGGRLQKRSPQLMAVLFPRTTREWYMLGVGVCLGAAFSIFISLLFAR